MTEDIESIRARIDRQRQRLARPERVEAVVAEPVPAIVRPLAARRSATSSTLGSLGRIVAEHPALVIGVGAAVLLAGPRRSVRLAGRSVRLARRALRGAVFIMAAYRGASTVLGMLPSSPRGDDGNAGYTDYPARPPRE